MEKPLVSQRKILGFVTPRRSCRKVEAMAMEAVTVEEVALRITDRAFLPVPLALFTLLLYVTALLPCIVGVTLFLMIR